MSQYWLTKLVDSRAVSIHVEGYAPMTVRRSYTMHDTGVLLPERVDIRWEGQQLAKLTVSGPRFKKDNTIGMASASTHFVLDTRRWQPETAQPDWLTNLVEHYEPGTHAS